MDDKVYAHDVSCQAIRYDVTVLNWFRTDLQATISKSNTKLSTVRHDLQNDSVVGREHTTRLPPRHGGQVQSYCNNRTS